MSYCKITPTILNKSGKEVDSKLFQSLFKLTKDRELSKQIWGLTRVPGFLDNKNIQTDENGEITIDSLREIVNIDSLLNDRQQLSLDAQNAGFINSNGDNVYTKNSRELLDKVVEFNNNHQQSVATISNTSDGYVVNIEDKTVNNTVETTKLKFKNTLNKKLLKILNNLGFDVSFINDENSDGIFNPLNAETNALGLKTIINIAKGQRGEDAFPEEFSHVIIEGLKNTTLGQRVLGLFNSDATIMDVLGDEYEEYNKRYNGNIEYLKREAAAKVLAEYFKGNPTAPVVKRLWDNAKRMFAKGNISDIDNAIEEAQTYFEDIINEVESGNIINIINKSDIVSAPTLFAVSRSVNKMRDTAEKSLEMMKRKLKILSLRSMSGDYDENLLESIKEAQKHYDNKRYVLATSEFLKEAIESLGVIREQLLEYVGTTKKFTNIQEIKRVSINLRQLKEFSEAYTPIIKDLISLDYFIQLGEVDIDSSEAEQIKALANQINSIIDTNNTIYRNLRFKVVYDFLKLYWGDDKMINIGKHKGTKLSLELMLKFADKDINILDRYISSMSDASDPLLQLIYTVVKDTKDQRDDRLRGILAEVETAHKKLSDAGYSSDFMYERDADGIPTGRIISNWDWATFEADKQAYLNRLKAEYDDPFVIKSKIEEWENSNMEPIVVDAELDRYELAPLKSNPRWYNENKLNRLSKEQREYYDTMTKLKSSLDSMLPARYISSFKAVQVRNDIVEAMDITNPKESARMILSNIKDNFVRREDDVMYGETIEDDDTLLGSLGHIGVKSQMLDMLGNPIQKIPVYYTMDLKDKRRLSTDFTATLMAYADMAINYNELSNVVDVLELTRDVVRDREVTQTSGEDKLVESFTVLKEKVSRVYRKKGELSNISDRLDDFYASALYGQKKKDEGTIQLGKHKIEVAPVLDAVKSYSSVVKLGLNLFSGISNVTMGNAQMLIESIGGEYFGKKDLLLATKDYYAMLPNMLGEFNSVRKTNKLDLLIDRFDALDEFSESLKQRGYYNSWSGRLIGNGNIFILNHLGEHMLHTKTMLAVLRNTKVKLDSQEISLIDAFETKDFGDRGVKLVLKKGVTDLNGNLLSSNDSSFSDEKKAQIDKTLNEFLKPIKNTIREANKSMHGAYNSDDLGAINRMALGRMAMQFRQWMPTHYYRRFGRAQYNSQLGKFREGYYVTLGRFMFNLFSDTKHLVDNFNQLKSQLNEDERANIRKALTEIGIFVGLTILIKAMGPVKDREGKWGERMIAYQLQRLQLETGASIPWLTMFDNFFTLIKSPLPATDNFDGILNLLEFWHLFDEVESGQYKGWSVYMRDVFKAIPIAGQIKRVHDISTEEYMFAIYN